MDVLLIAIALLLVLVGGWLFLRSGQLRAASGLPAGEVIYLDTGDWRRNDEPHSSPQYRLTGKPDYLLKSGEEIIPVEVKSTSLRGHEPYDSHKLQLAAYCLLVEDTHSVRPSHGILQYADATVRLPFNDPLQERLLATLDEMQAARDARDLPRNHDAPARCARCGFLHTCGSQALV